MSRPARSGASPRPFDEFVAGLTLAESWQLRRALLRRWKRELPAPHTWRAGDRVTFEGEVVGRPRRLDRKRGHIGVQSDWADGITVTVETRGAIDGPLPKRGDRVRVTGMVEEDWDAQPWRRTLLVGRFRPLAS